MHAGCQAKGVCIQHWIIRIDKNTSASAVAGCNSSHRRRGLHAHGDARGRRRKSKIRDEAVGVNVVAVQFVHEIGLRIVFLFELGIMFVE